jgi:ADP-heptose:LPS heptosyltransferase
MLYVEREDHHHIDLALAYQRADDLTHAMREIDLALAIRETPQARAIRAQLLLCFGRYGEGFIDFQSRWALYGNLVTPAGSAALTKFRRWRGESLTDKHIVLVHELGFGDTIMVLRYVHLLKNMGARITLLLPPPLLRLGAQLAPATDGVPGEADFVSTLFDLPSLLDTRPGTVPPRPFLNSDDPKQWASVLPAKPLIGIAWSSARLKMEGDIVRDIPLGQLLDLVNLSHFYTFVSLQIHDKDIAASLGVLTPNYKDFLDVVNVSALCDAVIAIDTAALHVAASIGHCKVFALLPFICSWRWRNGNPWYPKVKLCRQVKSGDWNSAWRSSLV